MLRGTDEEKWDCLSWSKEETKDQRWVIQFSCKPTCQTFIRLLARINFSRNSFVCWLVSILKSGHVMVRSVLMRFLFQRQCRKRKTAKLQLLIRFLRTNHAQLDLTPHIGISEWMQEQLKDIKQMPDLHKLFHTVSSRPLLNNLCTIQSASAPPPRPGFTNLNRSF